MAEITTDVGICNAALGRLGQDPIVTIGESTREGQVCDIHYEPTRNALLRSHPWNFAVKRSALTAASKIVSAITKASVAHVTTTTSHGLSTGDYVRFFGVVGMAEINGKASVVTVVDADEFTCDDIDSTSYSTYTSAGTVYTQAPRFEYDYAFALPTDCLKVVRTSQEACGRDHIYRIEKRLLVTDEDAVKVEYIYKATTVTDYDPLFVQILILDLAIAMCMVLADNASLLDKLQQARGNLAPSAMTSDAQEGAAREITDSNGWLQARL